MRFILFVYFILTSLLVFAEDMPKSSEYDIRMQRISYNPENVTSINTKLGFITTIIFDDEEIVEKAVTGFETGWKVIAYQNKLFVSSVPVEQEALEDSEDKESEVKKFEPTPKDWKTNLFVSTNKRSYSMDLNLVDETNNNYAHIVQFSYPEKEAEHEEKKQLNISLNNNKYAKNWDYFVKVGRGSENIVPDFAYDDGRLTYLGFGEVKNFPSVFFLNNGKEQIVNYSVEQTGNYKVMVIHKLNKKFILRYGNQVVGILNKSFGKYVKPYSTTSSIYVSREERLND